MVCVLLQVFWPALSGFAEGGRLAGEEGAEGFFVTGKISGEGGHEAVGGFLGFSFFVEVAILFAGLFDQSAESNGGAAGLRVQPIPVPGQERDFAGDDAEFGSAGAP